MYHSCIASTAVRSIKWKAQHEFQWKSAEAEKADQLQQNAHGNDTGFRGGGLH